MSRPSTVKAVLALLFVGILPAALFLTKDDSIPLSINNQQIELEIADDNNERILGLSNRESLDDGSGLLFIFDNPNGRPSIWMKDMKFSIDIIWLDKNKKVVHIEPNVNPESFPDRFMSDEASKYVLELNAGKASELGIQEDITLDF